MEYMRKYWTIGVVLFLAVVSIFYVTFQRNSIQVKNEKTSLRIGVSVYKWDDTFITGVRTALEEEAKRYEKKTGIKVTMDIADAKDSQMTQNSQVERFISLGCDVICINIVDRSSASYIIDKAMGADIPVVFFNREPVEEDMRRWDKLYYIGADAKETAVLQGTMLVNAYKKDHKSLDRNEDGVVSYVLLEGESSHQDSLIRTEWSIRTLKEGGVPLEKITGGIANWERSQASAWMEQWLKQYGDAIELVICNNDDMALGAIDAIKREEALGIKVVGVDGTDLGQEAVREGSLFGTVLCDSHKYAGAIFSVASSVAMGEDVQASLPLEDGRYYRCPQETLAR